VRDHAPNPQGATLSISRVMHVTKGSRSREIELLVTREMIGSAGISPARMKDPQLWWTILDAVEAHLNETFDSIDELPDQLRDLPAALHLGPDADRPEHD
jgi:hypothetical protein